MAALSTELGMTNYEDYENLRPQKFQLYMQYHSILMACINWIQPAYIVIAIVICVTIRE